MNALEKRTRRVLERVRCPRHSSPPASLLVEIKGSVIHASVAPCCDDMNAAIARRLKRFRTALANGG